MTEELTDEERRIIAVMDEALTFREIFGRAKVPQHRLAAVLKGLIEKGYLLETNADHVQIIETEQSVVVLEMYRKV